LSSTAFNQLLEIFYRLQLVLGDILMFAAVGLVVDDQGDDDE